MSAPSPMSYIGTRRCQRFNARRHGNSSFIFLFSPQFFTFEQYKKLLNLTPLSPGVVSPAHTTPEHTVTRKNKHTPAGPERAFHPVRPKTILEHTSFGVTLPVSTELFVPTNVESGAAGVNVSLCFQTRNEVNFIQQHNVGSSGQPSRKRRRTKTTLDNLV